MSNISKRRREGSRAKIKSMGDHQEFLRRITRSLYYGQLPSLPCLSLPVTEISCEAWSEAQRGRSLRRLHGDAAAGIARQACVSPCALVLAMLYLERLRACNPDYLAAAPPADLFLVSLMVGNKFLQDDGEDDEVICAEWAASGGLELDQLKKLELEFLSAIEWNVYVNDKNFEGGLSRLERRVALRQAQLHGFFTYSDLRACGADGALGPLVRALSAAWLGAALGYAAGLVALLTSTLLVSHAWLALQRLAHGPASLATHADHVTHSFRSDLATPYIPNSTMDDPLLTEDALASLPSLANPAPEGNNPDRIKCCAGWLRLQTDTDTPRRTWYDRIVTDWKSLEPWWSRTSALNWLYQSSLVSPVQRWLERLDEYAEPARGGRHRRLNLSRLAALAAVSDR